MEQLCSKAEKLQLDRYVIVSTSGFTQAGLGEAAAKGITAMTLDALDFSSVFKLSTFTQHVPELHHITIALDEGQTGPTVERLTDIEIETADGRQSIAQIAWEYVLRTFMNMPSPPPDELQHLRIVDEPKHWKAMVVGGQRFPAPGELTVEWLPRYQDVPGHKFKTQDGYEAFTAVLDLPTGAHQLTLVTTPAAEGGFTMNATLLPASPKRKTLKP